MYLAMVRLPASGNFSRASKISFLFISVSGLLSIEARFNRFQTRIADIFILISDPLLRATQTTEGSATDGTRETLVVTVTAVTLKKRVGGCHVYCFRLETLNILVCKDMKMIVVIDKV
jgi:hypothetical protein